MAQEARTQKQLIKYLQKKGCYVIKTKPGVGTPTGCPDVFAFLEGWWGAFEVKSSAKARWQPLQKETLARLEDWSFARMVCPENIDAVIVELEAVL